MQKDLRATWSQALGTFLLPLFLVLGLRWLLIEPFVIPSGSMIPTLLIHDHILVNKLAYGIRLPIGNGFLYKWDTPKLADVVVFKYPKNTDVFFVKRLIGLPLDRIRISSNIIYINDIAVQHSVNSDNFQAKQYLDDWDDFNYYLEQPNLHLKRTQKGSISDFAEFTVPANSLGVT